MPFTEAAGHRIEYTRIEGGTPALVLLHEGLGSISTWREFPADVARATGREVLVYSRYGHGNSDVLAAPREPRYMHDEALIALPQLLDHLGIERPLLIGHSDGASIALIHAGSGVRAVSGLMLLAPHVFVEGLTLASIAAIREPFERGGLRAQLARHHQDAERTFRGWNDAWLQPAFARWNIEEYLPAITVPVLVVQGDDDEYGTMEQARRIARAVRQVTVLELESCGHAPQRDQPERVVAAVREFVSSVGG
jgi:pimeloyl-ACP methyl ester carboxylesterase